MKRGVHVSIKFTTRAQWEKGHWIPLPPDVVEYEPATIECITRAGDVVVRFVREPILMAIPPEDVVNA